MRSLFCLPIRICNYEMLPLVARKKTKLTYSTSPYPNSPQKINALTRPNREHCTRPLPCRLTRVPTNHAYTPKQWASVQHMLDTNISNQVLKNHCTGSEWPLSAEHDKNTRPCPIVTGGHRATNLENIISEDLPITDFELCLVRKKTFCYGKHTSCM